MYLYIYPLSNKKLAPENGWLEYLAPFGMAWAFCQGLCQTYSHLALFAGAKTCPGSGFRFQLVSVGGQTKTGVV